MIDYIKKIDEQTKTILKQIEEIKKELSPAE